MICKKKTFVGVVIKKSGNKTVVIEVSRFYKHPKYYKVILSKTKFFVHDEYNQCEIGDKIKIGYLRPISKKKYHVYKCHILNKHQKIKL